MRKEKRIADAISFKYYHPLRASPLKGEDSGRSMVEMLGVLAIIGVLSAGALKGYSAAMFKYKMNQTIDEATKIFQRFEELNQKDWGGPVYEINTYEGEDYYISPVDVGLLEKCNSDGDGGCRLPMGSVVFSLFDDPEGTDYGCRAKGHMAVFSFNFTDAKSCAAFASVHWEQILPVEWWNPYGGIGIADSSLNPININEAIYQPVLGITTIPTASDIAAKCNNACFAGQCSVTLVYRDYC